MSRVIFRNVLVVCGLLLSLAGCGSREAAPPSLEAARPAATAAVPLPETSIYQLSGDWQDQNGEAFSLQALRGRPQVIAMVYGSCKGACPRIIADIQTMEALVQAKSPEGEIGFVLVTMDPEVDSHERLTDLAQKYGLGPSWRLLRGSKDQVRELAAVLGVKYRKISATDYAHSNTITVLDKDGSILHQKQELGSGVDDSAAALESLLPAADPCCQKSP